MENENMYHEFSEQVMQDAINEYGCNCNSCCSALLVNRFLDKKNKEQERKFIDRNYLIEFYE